MWSGKEQAPRSRLASCSRVGEVVTPTEQGTYSEERPKVTAAFSLPAVELGAREVPVTVAELFEPLPVAVGRVV